MAHPTSHNDETEHPINNLVHVQNSIRQAAARYKRNVEDIHLIAVSKTFGAEAILPVLKHGQRIFGENRVQEAKQKWPALKLEFPDIKLHLIGPLQSNKVKDAVKLFDAIETVDREKIAIELAKELKKQNKTSRLLIQVNTGEEAQKSGIAPNEVQNFVKFCQNDLKLPIEGLMCIPPANDVAAPHFALLHKLAQKSGLHTLSMGMSHDFEIAIMLGATHMRIGTAIFGKR